MKLLIITQVVDREDPILGFFLRWVAGFAAKCEAVTVIGQRVGAHELPPNVNVQSMRKEQGLQRMRQVMRFWSLIIRERKHYDAAFVHMTPIWVVLGFPVWVVLRKPVYLWYEARGSRWPLRVALFFVRAVFSASEHGMPIKSPKSVITGHGIDTDQFTPGTAERDPVKLVTVGRLTASKRLQVMVNCLAALPQKFHFLMIGKTMTPADELLLQALEDDIARRSLQEQITIKEVPHDSIVPELQTATAFLHASTTSLDKAVLEAMACGCIVISCAEAARRVLPAQLYAEPETMAHVLEKILEHEPAQLAALRASLREIVERDHGLKRLIDVLVDRMQPQFSHEGVYKDVSSDRFNQ